MAITAVPEQDDRLDLEGHAVSLDVMGGQNIAGKHFMANVVHVLGLKLFHGALRKRVAEFFSGHGQIRHTRQQGETPTPIKKPTGPPLMN